MITYEDLCKVNASIKTIDVKGKSYAQVNDRVKAFREICPGGSISTEIIDMTDGVVTMKATVTDGEGHILGTGLAQEKEQSSYINKTSFIENCETSAVGRALGFCGIGVDGSMASAEEVANAIMNQNKVKNADLVPHGERVTDDRLQNLTKEMERTGVTEKKLCEMFKVKEIRDLTEAQYIAAMNKFEKTPDKS